ncbi:MAG: prepilin-type N-terminal cleavage/methylation domain-containing protein [Paraclostridium sp.]
MRKNNNGFTILEVIIAMAILSVVILVGYKVINGSDKVSGAQKDTAKSQLSTNLINKYVSKDIEILEVSKDEKDIFIELENIVDINEVNKTYSQEYSYIIDTVNHNEGSSVVDKVEYTITHKGNIDENTLKGVYSVNRKSKKEDGTIVSNLDLISGQKTINSKSNSINMKEYLTNDVRPFTIDRNDTNVYTVGIYYEANNKEKNFEFDVSPRMNVATAPPIDPDIPNPPIEPPVKPEIDPDFDGNSAYIRFKYKDELAWSDAGPKSGTGNEGKGDPIGDTKNRYKISAKLEPQNSAGFAEASLDNTSEATAKNQGNFPKGNYDQIKISLFGDAILKDLSIQIKYKKDYRNLNYKVVDNTLIIPIEKTIKEDGKNEDQSLITIEGYLEKKNITSKYGDIIINLGHSKTKS